MKKVIKLSLISLYSVIILLSLVFVFIEARLLFSADYISYDSPFLGFIRYLSRLAFSVIVLLKTIYEIRKINKKDKYYHLLLALDISFVLSSFVILEFSANYVGLICIILSILSFVLKLLNKNYLPDN